MKKILISICALLAYVGSALADDTFSVDNVSLPLNGEADVTVRFSLDQGSTCSGYTFWLQVPDELAFVTYEKNSKTYITYTAGDCYDETPTITPNIDGGYLKVGCLTANSDPLNKQSGILVTFRLKAVGAVSVGNTFDGTLTMGTISAENGTVHDVANASFTVTISEPEDGRLHFDEASTSLPNYTAGEKADVTMNRTIKGGEWSTIVLPFTLPKAKAEAAFGDDAEYYKFTGFETEVDVDGDLKPTGIKMHFTEHKLENALSAITGGQPYLIKTSKDISVISADQVKLVDAVAPTTVEDDNYGDVLGGKFTGTFVKTKIPANGLFISEDKFWYSNGNTTVKAFRAWFDLDAVLNKQIELSRITMSFSDLTSVKDINRETITNNRYYDLQGRRVDSAQFQVHSSQLKKGIYIKNGKKVVKK